MGSSERHSPAVSSGRSGQDLPIEVRAKITQGFQVKNLLLFPLAALTLILAACTIYEDVAPHSRGWRSPYVEAPDQFGRVINLQRATSGQWAVVFFYPKADTPG